MQGRAIGTTDGSLESVRLAPERASSTWGAKSKRTENAGKIAAAEPDPLSHERTVLHASAGRSANRLAMRMRSTWDGCRPCFLAPGLRDPTDVVQVPERRRED